MKEFFQKKSVAITITLVVIALAVVIGAVSAPKGAQTQSSASLSADASGWAKKNYAQYEDFLDDDADLFDDDAIETFAKYDAQLDYGYGSILGLVSTDSLDGKSMEDYAMDASADLELGDSDMLLLIDTDTELGARIFRTGEVAVAEGDFALMGQGKLKLSYLTSDDEVLIGDQIVTSGLGGYYPSGLVIGSVESVRTDDDGLARYAVLAPMMDFDALTEVFVITDYDIVD